jgi:heat-inducible transcriptional repressor
MTNLDDRKGAILRAIVEQYVASAQPVGSRTVAEASGLGVSAATIRNEMGALERDGLIHQPHTSAGRVPTDLGYRYYVDHLAGAGTLTPELRREVADFFTSASRAMDDLLHDTSLLLARITHHAALIVGPQPDVVRIRDVHLSRLQPHLLLAVVILSNGAVEKQLVTVDDGADDDVVAAARTRLGSLLLERTLGELPELADEPSQGRGHPDVLVRAVYDALRELGERQVGEPLYVGGVSRLAAEHEAFGDTAHATRLLELLEQHTVLAALLRELLGPGLTVRIGSENEQADLRECSIVLAPYLVEGEPIGTVGVLGPTRMDYRQATAAVSAVSQRLGRRLSS